MAQQGVRNQPESAPSAPRSARVPRGKTAGWDYSRYRLTINNAEEFMDFMRGYPAREGVTIFLYRLLPKLDLSLIGNRESNIQKGGYDDLQLFGVEAIGEKFKNGKYYLKVTDSNRPEGQREVVKSCTFKVVDAGPPVYDIRTLELAHPDNVDEVNRQITAGVLIRDANGVPRIRTQADAIAPAAGPAVVVQPAADPLAGNSLVGQIVLAALGKANQSPHDVVKDLVEVNKLLQPAGPPVESVEATIRRVMAEERNGRGGSDFDAYERVEGFITKVRGAAGIVGAAAPAGGSLADGFAASNPATWMPHVAPAIREVRGLFTDLFAWGRRSAPAAAANNQTPAATTTAPAAIDGERPPATMQDAIQDVAEKGLRMMDEGVRGFDYAAYVCGLYHPPIGLQVFRQLEAFGGVVGLVSMMAMNPLTRAIVNDAGRRAQVEAFLSDFFSFEPEPVEEGESAPAAPAAGANGSAAASA